MLTHLSRKYNVYCIMLMLLLSSSSLLAVDGVVPLPNEYKQLPGDVTLIPGSVIGEQNDIASTHPDIVKEFEEYFETDYIESPEWPVPFP